MLLAVFIVFVLFINRLFVTGSPGAPGGPGDYGDGYPRTPGRPGDNGNGYPGTPDRPGRPGGDYGNGYPGTPDRPSSSGGKGQKKPLPGSPYADRPSSGDLISLKPEMPDSWKNRHKKPFHPAWMDYCDPYHCNDYHKRCCGLNRKNMKFKWFQSQCHLIINNQCATFRGNLKYDIIDNKFCNLYAMHLRIGCPRSCKGEDVAPTCAINSVSNHAALFVNTCALEMVNCRTDLEEYEGVSMDICYYYLRHG